MSDKDENKKKEHADFQDKYRKSSNFPSLNEKEAEKLKPKGGGDLKVKDSKSKEA
ncbi:hypothetical protein [Psychroserpens sp. Hel_I_66]|uniref:hypothetical protein n=1 Tax=Psychroserpens sp. Hel_I_66 TaxID=1250004 RepID=UPI000AB7F0C0|nr:hypothetical protein [Psychroserpens sp. Hel_I_66]